MEASAVALQTERLLIKPLTARQLLSYLRNDGALEKELGLNPYPRPVPDELKEAVENTLLPLLADPHKNGLFATLWTMIERDINTMVGDLCFKGGPNERGELEIGYGTLPNFQNKGYATEAVKALTAWALAQPDVGCVLAETEEANRASHRTLEKAGFERYKREGSMLWWRKAKAMPSPFAAFMEERRTR